MEECSDNNIVNSAVTDSSNFNFRENFDRKLVEHDEQHQGSHRKAWTSERISDVINDIKKARVSISSGQRRTAMDYYWKSKYDIITNGNEDCLTFKRLTDNAPTIRILPREQYFDVLLDTHNSCGHGGRDKILQYIKNKYYIPKKAVEIFVSLCPTCETKRDAPRKSIVMKPILSHDFNLRGQVNLMDFQSCPDGEFQWLLNYQDNATKFVNLRPLKTKSAVEVASELLKIFLNFGAPNILLSDNGHEFTENVIKELGAMWPECKIVHENPLRPQTLGCFERSNQDIENMLRDWMNEKKSTNWSVGCFFVQYYKNAAFHQIIGRSPYKALFGSEPKTSFKKSGTSTTMLLTIKPEEEFKTIKQEPVEATDSDYVNNENNSNNVIANIENLESNFTCAVCHKDVIGAHKNTVGEEGYGSKVCATCQIVQNIKVEIDETHTELKRQAEIMIDTTVNKIPKSNIDNSVWISVPQVDHRPLDMTNIQGESVDMRNSDHNWNKCVTIKKELNPYSDTTYSNEISENSKNVAGASQSYFGRQGFHKCSCKPTVNQCRNNRCACFKNKVNCGSECHKSFTCVNK